WAAARRCALRCRDDDGSPNAVVVRALCAIAPGAGTHNHRYRLCEERLPACPIESFRGMGRGVRRDDSVGVVAMKSSRGFDHVDTWVFDLDNTLYPHHVNLWQQVDARISAFVSRWLNVTAEEARAIQKDYYRRFGTTMRGMMTLHGVDADDY